MYIMYIHGGYKVSWHVLKNFKSLCHGNKYVSSFPFSLSLVTSANSYSDGESCLWYSIELSIIKETYT